MEREHGGTGTRFLIFVCIVGIAIWVMFSIMPTWWDAMTLKDEMKSFASYASTGFTDEMIADSLAKKAKQRGIKELTKEQFLRGIQRSGGIITVKTHYTRDNVLIGTKIKIKHWDFNLEVKEHY